jgi:antitoxin YqcF
VPDDKPQVRRFDDPSGEHMVHVAVQEGVPAPALTSWGTVDMSQFHTGLPAPDDRELRIELVGVARREYTLMGHVLASCAFNVAHGLLTPHPDAIFPDAIAVNDAGDSPCRHAMLVLPFLWGDDGIPPLEKESAVTTWLQVVPITDAEKALAEADGPEALADHLQTAKVDVLDPSRAAA